MLVSAYAGNVSDVVTTLECVIGPLLFTVPGRLNRTIWLSSGDGGSSRYRVLAKAGRDNGDDANSNALVIASEGSWPV